MVSETLYCKNCGNPLSGRQEKYCSKTCCYEYVDWFNSHKSKKRLSCLKMELSKLNVLKIQELRLEILKLKVELRDEKFKRFRDYALKEKDNG